MTTSKDNHAPQDAFCGRTRREFLWQTGGGFTGLALGSMLAQDGFLASQSLAADGVTSFNPLQPKPPAFAPKAKRVIFLFMYGGPSHVDLFDYKPELFKYDGKTIEVDTKGRSGNRNVGRVIGPKWKFKQHGECGAHVSTLFPHLSTCVDDIAFLKGMYAESPLHGSAMLMMNSGRILPGAPAIGSWVNYGLGSVNENLPGFVVMLDKTGGPISGAKNWSSGYMPATYAGTVLRGQGAPILDLANPKGRSRAMQRKLIDRLRMYNDRHAALREGNPDLEARIQGYELAYRMQTTAPEAVDIDKEKPKTKELYGIGEGRTDDFGRKCLLARRLVERGVRFVQIYSGGAHNDANWDAHGDLVKNHEYHCGNTDKPIAGLLKDLKQRGMLDDTLVVWGGEFGRQPIAEYAEGTGRDHNSWGFTMWMAGGGIKGGTTVGGTDELGNKAVPETGRYHVNRLHATILNQLGLDPNALSYFHAGLDQKLVGVEGAEPITELFA
ncbi:MAG: DUF1501 domain-containing protein [Phycisphaerales bacterium]|nr:DUF1501 domain-containing protein [Phycisphaerales bacterium]